MVRATKPELRSLKYFLQEINEKIIPEVLAIPPCSSSVSQATLNNYLLQWGFSYRKNKRAIFFDGHEREDVVTYRNEWAVRMLTYMARSEFYEGDEMEKVLEPNLVDGEAKIVIVTHVESTLRGFNSLLYNFR